MENEEQKTENEMEALEKEMNKLKVDIVEKTSVNLDKMRGFLYVEVDIDCPIKIDFMADYVMTKKVQRGSTYYVVFDEKQTEKLTMRIGVEIPLDYSEVYAASINRLEPRATTFPDLCWIHAEGTTPQTLHEVATKLRDGAIIGDLTWVLPSKFVDDFVEMMHTLNQSIIAGLMQDAIIYGPYVR